MNVGDLKRPNILIAVLQLIAFIVLYEVFATITGWLASLIGYLLDLIPFFNPFNYFAKPSEGIFFTFTPIVIISCLFYVTSFIFKKYLFSIISVILHFMLMAYLAISVVMEQIQTHGLISWEAANQRWFTLILCGVYLFLFGTRSDLLMFIGKAN